MSNPSSRFATEKQNDKMIQASLAAKANQSRWLQVGTLIDGESDSPRRDVHVVYDAHSIRYVGEASPPQELVGPDGVDGMIMLPNHTLLPGLIEGHAHMFLDGAPMDIEERKAYLRQSPQWMLDRSEARLDKLLRTGVMAVRDGGDNRGIGLALSHASRKRKDDDAPRPYVDSPGAAIHHKGRYGSFMSRAVEQDGSPKACVAVRVANGADRIKLIATGIINFKTGTMTSSPQMDVDELKAFAHAAGEYGKPTFAHASGTDGVEAVIEAGIDSVEHGYFVTEDQLGRMADRQIPWVPTLAPLQVQIDHASVMGWSEQEVTNLQRIVDTHMKMLVRAERMGVPIVAGSDAGSCGVSHGLGFLHELELMARGGLSPMTVIQAATGRSAKMIGYHEPIGRLAVGARPRMILTEHDPLSSVTALGRQKLIIFDGQVLKSDGNRDATGL